MNIVSHCHSQGAFESLNPGDVEPQMEAELLEVGAI